MSTTIDSLDIRITTSAGNSAVNIERLATALGKLKENGKLTTVVNNLTKLGNALDKLNSSSNSGISRLATSLNSLSSFKASGFTTTVNALNRIPKVLASLDTATLDKFKRKMEEIANALAPLAAKIDTVATGFSRLPSRIKSVTSATNSATTATNNFGGGLSNLNLFATIQNMQSLVSAINLVVDALSKALNQAIEWDGIQYRFGRAFGEDAEEVYEHITKINEALGINIQEFMQYSSLYGSLLSGFGIEQEKVTAISVGLTELSYDLWAAYNDRAKSLEQASEAVRSAITGEIEPIRNLGISLTEASLQEFIDSTHLAGLSIEKMTEAQKAEVRYAAMVNAAMNQGIIGTYAKEMNTAEGAVRSLTQSWKTLVQAFGSLFIPVLQVVIPYLTAFVEILTDAVFWVAKFFGVEIQKIDWSNTSKGVGSLADGAANAATGLGKASEAAKKLKNYTMGFDELNVIDPNSGSGSGSGGSGGVGAGAWGSGLDLDSLWDDALLEEASKKVDEIKAKILEWKEVLIAIGVILTGIAVHKVWVTLAGWGATLVTKFMSVTNVVSALWGAFKGSSAATSALTFMFPKLSAIGSALGSAASAVGTFLAGISAPVWATIAAVIAAIASVVYFLYENWDKVVKAVQGFFAENIAPKLEEIRKHFNGMFDALGPFGDVLKKIGKGIADFFSKIKFKDILQGIGKVFEWLGGVIFAIVGGVIATAFNTFVGFIENLIQWFSGIVKVIAGVYDFIVALFTGGDIGAAWNKIWDGVKDVVGGLWGLILDPIKNVYNGIVSWFTKLWDELVGHSIVPDTINAIVDWFAKLPSNVLKSLQKFVDNVIAKFKEAWGKVTDFFSVEKWKKKIEEAVGAIKKFFKLPSFPSIKLSVTWDKNVSGVKKIVTEALGLDGWPNLKWSTYATGGFPSMGEMFIAREAGPELVGRIGNRSTVANNDQIVTAVSQGVYSAVKAAMSGDGGGSGQNINVYLDGKQIYASVKKTEAQQGASLMGNQLGYLY